MYMIKHVQFCMSVIGLHIAGRVIWNASGSASVPMLPRVVDLNGESAESPKIIIWNPALVSRKAEIFGKKNWGFPKMFPNMENQSI